MRRITRISGSKLREMLADLVSRVAYGNERVVVHRYRKDLVAIVPIEDLRRLEALDAQELEFEAAKDDEKTEE